VVNVDHAVEQDKVTVLTGCHIYSEDEKTIAMI
jgi:hypothetical protein